jgi:carbonic anhydrase
VNDSLLDASAESRHVFLERHHSLLTQLRQEGQHPRALMITCCDSRIMLEGLFSLVPGDFFVLRNIANTIPPYIQSDPGMTAALEYAFQYLAVPHLIVCGHTDCGGVRGLEKTVDLTTTPALSRWLQHIRPAEQDVSYRMHDLTAEERHRAIVEQHVLNQLANLRSFPFVRAAETTGSLTLHGWVYYLELDQIGYYDSDIEQFHLS